MTLTCQACGTSVTVTLGAAAQQVINGITIATSGRPVAVCDCGHVTPVDVIATVLDAFHARMPTATTRWRRGSTCSVCRAKLTLPARWTRIPVTIEHPLVFTIICDVPAVRCPACSVDQLPHYAKNDWDLAVRRMLSA